MIRLIDTHCHLDFNRFDADRSDVILRAIEAGVVRIVVPGLDLATSHNICTIAEQYPNIYAAVGIHPNELANAGDLEQTLSEIRDLAAHNRVVAVGEIGLDYYWKNSPPEVQREWLKCQLNLGRDLSRPVILHNRDSTADIVAMLFEWVASGLPEALHTRPGVVHSFSGNWADAKHFLDLGFYIGFTGPITYKNADEVRDVAMNAPIDRILIETDAPFLPPVPYRGKRNEPAYVRHVAEKLAEVRGTTLEAIAELTTQNASRLFGWDVAVDMA
jgi:TatD DNase family protein